MRGEPPSRLISCRERRCTVGSDGTRVGRRTRVGQAAAAPRRRRPCGGDTAAACLERPPPPAEAATALGRGGDRRVKGRRPLRSPPRRGGGRCGRRGGRRPPHCGRRCGRRLSQAATAAAAASARRRPPRRPPRCCSLSDSGCRCSFTFFCPLSRHSGDALRTSRVWARVALRRVAACPSPTGGPIAWGRPPGQLHPHCRRFGKSALAWGRGCWQRCSSARSRAHRRLSNRPPRTAPPPPPSPLPTGTTVSGIRGRRRRSSSSSSLPRRRSTRGSSSRGARRGSLSGATRSTSGAPGSTPWPPQRHEVRPGW